MSLVTEGNHSVDAIAFRRALIDWGQKNFRPFPWRFTSDPYCLLMAEVMLHRTNAPQVVPVYERFIQRYPDLSDLAQATEEELQEILYSLGLRWRVRLIHEMATELASRFNGQIPVERESLLALPGISDYIASALRCFSWNQPDALIDTNTVRIIARLFGVPLRDSLRRNKHFMTLIGSLVDPEQPKPYNYALLDLANKICLKSQLPNCPDCPVRLQCLYGSNLISQNSVSASTRVAESAETYGIEPRS
jgi:A/G-specific adenine glycosylase